MGAYQSRFFYSVTLGRTDALERIVAAREPQKLPVVLSADEIVRFLVAVPGLRNRALTTAYGAGLRVGEVARLTIVAVDSGRMLIGVEHGKGGKDRYVMLSPQLLQILRAYAPLGVGLADAAPARGFRSHHQRQGAEEGAKLELRWNRTLTHVAEIEARIAALAEWRHPARNSPPRDLVIAAESARQHAFAHRFAEAVHHEPLDLYEAEHAMQSAAGYAFLLAEGG